MYHVFLRECLDCKMKKILAFVFCCLFSVSVLADVVDSFEVKGNQRLSDDMVIAYLPFKKGDDISSSDVNAGLKRLYQTGFFDDVSVDLKNGKVIIKLTERPIISSISFDGNKKIDEDVLEKELQIKVRDIYVPTKVQADVDRLKMIYQRMGLFDAKISADVQNKNENRVDITFKIKGFRKIAHMAKNDPYVIQTRRKSGVLSS